ncbi:hypothetical protein FACS1894190_06920 [Spirochaetia bacterium]|nr:hypothetical protein FACS1894190_06920 [Spirochaetia bacterium]
MMKLTYTYFQNGDWLVGYFDSFPEHLTQGKNLEELEYMLKALYKDLELDKYKKGELVLAT